MKKILYLLSAVCFLFFVNIAAGYETTPEQQTTFTPLQQAVLNGDYREAARILDENPECIDDPAVSGAVWGDDSGNIFMVTDDPEIFPGLMYYDEKVYRFLKEGATALHLALMCRNEEMVRLLVESGANLYAKDYEGWDAVAYGAAFSSVPSLKIILEKEGNWLLTRNIYMFSTTALHWAAAFNDVDMVRYLVEECGMDMNDPCESWDTPLDFALMTENIPVEKYLVQKEALTGEEVVLTVILRLSILSELL